MFAEGCLRMTVTWGADPSCCTTPCPQPAPAPQANQHRHLPRADSAHQRGWAEHEVRAASPLPALKHCGSAGSAGFFFLTLMLQREEGKEPRILVRQHKLPCRRLPFPLPGGRRQDPAACTRRIGHHFRLCRASPLIVQGMTSHQAGAAPPAVRTHRGAAGRLCGGPLLTSWAHLNPP